MTKNIEDLALVLEDKVDKQLMSPKILLGHCRLIDEGSRQTSSYTDPFYFPFYYHLGNVLSPRTMVQFGVRLGLSASCFLRSCKSVEHFLSFQQQDTGTYYSTRLAKANIKDQYKKNLNLHCGLITDSKFLNSFESDRWDLAIIDDEVGYDDYMSYLDALWKRMNSEGIIVQDYLTKHEPARKAFMDFARANNRNPVFLKTRYGVGLLQR